MYIAVVNMVAIMERKSYKKENDLIKESPVKYKYRYEKNC